MNLKYQNTDVYRYLGRSGLCCCLCSILSFFLHHRLPESLYNGFKHRTDFPAEDVLGYGIAGIGL